MGILPFPTTQMEQGAGRDAATDRLLAKSDFFEPMTSGSLPSPGAGRRVGFSIGTGFITLHVLPATN